LTLVVAQDVELEFGFDQQLLWDLAGLL